MQWIASECLWSNKEKNTSPKYLLPLELHNITYWNLLVMSLPFSSWWFHTATMKQMINNIICVLWYIHCSISTCVLATSCLTLGGSSLLSHGCFQVTANPLQSSFLLISHLTRSFPCCTHYEACLWLILNKSNFTCHSLNLSLVLKLLLNSNL